MTIRCPGQALPPPRIDPLEVRDDRRPHGDLAHVQDRICRHDMLLGWMKPSAGCLQPACRQRRRSSIAREVIGEVRVNRHWPRNDRDAAQRAHVRQQPRARKAIRGGEFPLWQPETEDPRLKHWTWVSRFKTLRGSPRERRLQYRSMIARSFRRLIDPAHPVVERSSSFHCAESGVAADQGTLGLIEAQHVNSIEPAASAIRERRRGSSPRRQASNISRVQSNVPCA